MTIIRPSSTTQEITIIPRYYGVDLTLILVNEETQQNYTFGLLEHMYLNGYLTLFFDLNCLEGQSFNLELTNGYEKGSEVVLFRGKVFATDTVDLENYKLSNGSIL